LDVVAGAVASLGYTSSNHRLVPHAIHLPDVAQSSSKQTPRQMSFAEFRPSKTNMFLFDCMNCYRLALQMPDGADFTVPSWFLRKILEDQLSNKTLIDLPKDSFTIKGFTNEEIKSPAPPTVTVAEPSTDSA
jgi:hypothetical protein